MIIFDGLRPRGPGLTLDVLLYIDVGLEELGFHQVQDFFLAYSSRPVMDHRPPSTPWMEKLRSLLVMQMRTRVRGSSFQVSLLSLDMNMLILQLGLSSMDITLWSYFHTAKEWWESLIIHKTRRKSLASLIMPTS